MLLPTTIPVSSGKGATTCSYFLPGDKKVIYASTHLGGDACPPKPDHSIGYVWALYDTYDIFKANADGANQVRLTDVKGYDARGHGLRERRIDRVHVQRATATSISIAWTPTART